MTAAIKLTPTSAVQAAGGGAWVVVAPPDYAPRIDGVITLYDVLRQLAIDHFGAPAPGTPSFDRDIAPILQRVHRLRFVHDDATWSDPVFDSPQLRSKLAADKADPRRGAQRRRAR